MDRYHEAEDRITEAADRGMKEYYKKRHIYENIEAMAASHHN